MASGLDFSGMVPGLDFLQSLVKGASTALPGLAGMASVPGIGQWVTPTLDPEELDKRISELRTVQFWLEQNAKLLGTTIQALEVQRMTLATLQTMNLPLSELRDALSIKPAASAFAKDPAPRPQPTPEPARQPAPAVSPPGSAPAAAGASDGDADGGHEGAATSPAVPGVDPMQWWGALTQQFTEIASQALQAGAAQQAAMAQAAGAASHPAPPAKAAKAAKAARPAPAAKAAGTSAPAAAPAQAVGSAAAKRPGVSRRSAGPSAAVTGAGPVRRASPRSR